MLLDRLLDGLDDHVVERRHPGDRRRAVTRQLERPGRRHRVGVLGHGRHVPAVAQHRRHVRVGGGLHGQESTDPAVQLSGGQHPPPRRGAIVVDRHEHGVIV